VGREEGGPKRSTRGESVRPDLGSHAGRSEGRLATITEFEKENPGYADIVALTSSRCCTPWGDEAAAYGRDESSTRRSCRRRMDTLN
jgi:hypothetical protein